MGIMRFASFAVVGLCAASLGVRGSTAQTSSAQSTDGKRELTLSGCLLRSGYAGYQIDDARLEAIDGKVIPEAAMTSAQVGVPKKWALEGGGNLGPRVGERVLVVGRSDWQQPSASQPPADDLPAKAPVLEVGSVKTLESSCSV